MRRVVPVLVLISCLVAALALVASPRSKAATTADPVIAAAGDIACAPGTVENARKCHQAETSDLLVANASNYSAVLTLGDNQYDCGQASAFASVYDPTWGRVKSLTQPVPGDGDYSSATCSTPGASGYFGYFGDAATPLDHGCTSACRGYYSFDIGAWHIVALNSECTQPGVGGCATTSPQVQWLKADLAAHPAACTLAYFQRPVFKDAGGTVARTMRLFKALYAAGAELILVGNQHSYERYAPMSPSDTVDAAKGVRQFVVGTGGRSQVALAATPPLGAEVRNSGTFGVLELTLHDTSYDWRFVPEAGKTFTDSGTQVCH